MSKRAADKYLTDQNWDNEDHQDDDEDEQGGTFQSASVAVVSQRKIIKAKRRCTPGAEIAAAGFSGFAGFTKSPSTTSGSTTQHSSTSLVTSIADACSVSFPLPVPSSATTAQHLGHSAKMSALNKNVLSWISDQVLKDASCDLSPVFIEYSKQVKNIANTDGNGVTTSTSNSSEISSTSVIPLSQLFQKFGDAWECPVCMITNKNTDAKCAACTSSRPSTMSTTTTAAVTTPVTLPTGQPSLAEMFKKSPDEWECKSCWIRNKSDAVKCVACCTDKPETTTSTVSKSTFSFGPRGGFKFELPPGQSMFTFGTGLSSSNSAFSFKPASSTSTDTSSKSGFSFGASTLGTGMSTFGSGTSTFGTALFKPSESTSVDANKGDDGEEEYVPPKAETVIHTESDAFYTVRCKLFYQKDGTWHDRGLGNLFLKPCGDNTQLLIRADTTLGNILLNVKLTAKTPVGRQGNNNVSLACVPNPPLETSSSKSAAASKQPVCMLIRVKTSELADELLAKINETTARLDT